MAASAEAVIAPGCRPYVRRRPERGTLHGVLRKHITLLAAATASGLELMAHDGCWVPIDTTGDVIIVDAGDMLCCRT